MSEIRDVLSRALAAGGAAVERIEPDGLEAALPPELASTLELDEFARLGCGPVLPPDAVRVHLESGWTDKLESLVGSRGTCLSVRQTAMPSARPPSPGDLLPKAVVLDNATCRYRSFEPARTRFLLLIFRIVAASDEKREDLMAACVNESNGADAEHLVDPLLDGLRTEAFASSSPPEEADIAAPWSHEQAARWCERVLPLRVRHRLQPFLSGMERRLAKDLQRLYAYHTNLLREAAERIRDIEGRNRADEKLKRREELRSAAVEREYRAKVADLQLKYAMNVEVSLLQAVRLTAPVRRLGFNILRRKGVRPYHLDWSALSHHLDELPCEGCGRPSPSHAICDDRLHILCGNCLASCPECGKPYCRACHPKTCPRCRQK